MNNPLNQSSGKAGMQGPSGESILLRPYNLKELAALYGVSSRTFAKWLLPFEKQVGNRVGYFFSIPQVKTIFSNLGFPGIFKEEENL